MSTPPALVDYDDAVARFDPVIGIEVHVELGTVSKMFDGAPTVFGAEPEHPGDAGVARAARARCRCVNRTAVESAILIGLALNCQIAELCRFARKNYFYPDNPKNYQISQYDEPIAFEGWLDVELDDGTVVRVEIERAHMEEDAGKNTHVGGATGRIHGAEYSLVDYNRAGIPLVEIVTKPITGVGRARARGRARVRADAARHLPRLGRLRGADGARERPGRRQPLAAPDAGLAAGHADRDQERQQLPLGRALGPVRDLSSGGRAGRGRSRSSRRRGTGTRTPARRRRAGQVRRRGLPVLPRAGPGAARAEP